MKFIAILTLMAVMLAFGAFADTGSVNVTIEVLGSCTEDWSCTEYSACVGGVQTRTCTDANACGTEDNKPTESQACGGAISGSGGGSSTVTSEREEEVTEEFPMLLEEPETCGNNIIDEGETALNCNKDIKPTITDYLKCVGAGKDDCVYYNQYLQIVVLTTGIAGAGALYVFNPGNVIRKKAAAAVKRPPRVMRRF